MRRKTIKNLETSISGIEGKENQTESKDIFNITLKDFGSITSGRISVKPLTIFIGPNGSGKSYAAKMVHAIARALSLGTKGLLIPREPLYKSKAKHILKKFPEFIEELKKLQIGSEISIPQDKSQELINLALRDTYEYRLSKEISRLFGKELNELKTFGKNSFKINVSVGNSKIELSSRKEKLEVDVKDIHLLKGFEIRLTLKDPETLQVTLLRTNNVIINFVNTILKKQKSVIDNLIDSIYTSLVFFTDYTFIYPTVGLFSTSHYLPAERSGILQTYREIASALVRSGAEFFEDQQMRSLPGTIADFISTIITLPNKEGKLYDTFKPFENEILNGEIIVERTVTNLIAEVKYKFRNAEISLEKASSSVSELAPLFLYAEYLLKPGDILIIEEPEAHIHPKNQRILAKLLTRLVRSGVYVIVTTHSDFLIEQINTFILLSKIPKEERKEKYGYGERDYILPEEVSPYLMKFDTKTGGYQAKKLNVDYEKGISEQEFIKIYEELYEEAFKIKEDLRSRR